MNFSVVIPWRESSDRLQIFNWIYSRWEKFCSDFDGELIISDSGAKLFSRSASRNLGAEQAKSDLIFFADADVCINRDLLERCLNKDYRWAIPASDYIGVVKQRSSEILQMDSSIQINPKLVIKKDTYYWGESWAGIQIITKEDFELLNGWDERFIGWGEEDIAFVISARTVLGPETVFPNTFLYHFWHSRGQYDKGEHPYSKKNANLFEKYKIAANNIDAMLELKEGAR